MNEENTSFERLLPVMPEGWQDKAKELGALSRAREIKKAIDLLRLVFIYLTEGKSFRGTAVLLKLAGMCSITKSSIHEISKMRTMASLAVRAHIPEH
jgi:hypothetical protein